MSNLKSWVRSSIYDTMFARPVVPVPGRFHPPSKTNSRANDELHSLFTLDVVEDEAKLSIKDLQWHRDETGTPLRSCQYYREGLTARGFDPDTLFHPRFVDVLVIDEWSLSTLLALPEPPPGGFRQPVDTSDMRTILNTAIPKGSFVWLLDMNMLLNKPRWIEEDPDFSEQVNEHCRSDKADQGVMQVRADRLRHSWFHRLSQEDQLSGMNCNEALRGSGSGVYESIG